MAEPKPTPPAESLMDKIYNHHSSSPSDDDDDKKSKHAASVKAKVEDEKPSARGFRQIQDFQALRQGKVRPQSLGRWQTYYIFSLS